LVGFLDSLGEGVEGLHVLLDLLNWEFDEHTGDLWGLLLTDDHLNVVEDEVTNLLLHVWVSLLDGVDQSRGGLEVLLLWGQLLLLLLLLWWLLHHLLLLHHGWVHHWLLWHAWLLWHSLLAHHWHVVLSAHGSHVLSHWLSVSSHVVSLVVLATHSSVLVSSSHVTLVLSWLLLDQLQQLLDDVRKVWLVGKLVPLESNSELADVLFPISLVSHLLELEVSDLLNLVMVDDEALSVVGLSVKGLLSHGASIWLLVADEGVGVVLVTLLESHSLNFSVGLEEVGEFLLGPASWEVLDVEVASLLGVLVSDGLLELLLLSLWLRKELTDVKLLAVAHVLVVQSGHGLVHGFSSVGLVRRGLVFVAHESELTHVVLVGNQRFNGTIWLKQLLDVLLFHFFGDILEV
jgi:hypothetical protein